MQYYREKEDDMEKQFVNIGFTLTEDTGRRKKFMCDRLFDSDNGLKIAVDHKSTEKPDSIKIEKQQLDKLREEADKLGRIPILTISFHSAKKIYAVIAIEDLEGMIV